MKSIQTAMCVAIFAAFAALAFSQTQQAAGGATPVSASNAAPASAPGASAQAPGAAVSATFTPKPKAASFDFYDFFDKKCDEFRSDIAALPPETTGTVVLFGDSLTQGNKVKRLGGRIVLNQGITSDQIARPEKKSSLRTRVDLVGKGRPAHVFVMIGINDLGMKSVETAMQQYASLIDDLHRVAPGAKIHVESLFPTTGKYAKRNSLVLQFNEQLLKLAKEKGVDFVDVHPLLKGENGELRDEYTKDGIHLTPAAYEILNSALEQVLSQPRLPLN